MIRFLFILMLASTPALSQHGSIVGHVSSGSDGAPLTGVNVILEGTGTGTVSDLSGVFILREVPPGVHSVTFSLVGFRRETVPGIRVEAGQASRVDVKMAAISLQTEPVVVTASRRGQSFQEAPASVSVLDAAGIALRNSVTVDDALRYIPGVNMTEFQVNVRGSSGYSRGVGSRVLFLVDGTPLLTGDTGEINYETIPVGQIERIEVLKGASSALYGSNALGGVINIITKRIGDRPQTSLHTYGGVYGSPSYSTWDWGGGTRTLAGVAGSHSERLGDLGFVIFGSRQVDDGYRLNDYKQRYNAGAKIDYAVSPSEDATVTFNLMHQNRGSFTYWEDLDHALVPAAGQGSQWVSSTRFYLTGGYSRTFSSSLLGSIKVLWYRNHFTDNVSLGGDDSRSDVVLAEAQAHWMPSQAHIVTFGLEGSLDRVEANLFGDRSGNGEAMYAQDEIRLLDEVRLTLGARYDVRDVDSLGSFTQFNPKAAIVYTPGQGLALRASVGRGFRSPSIAEAFTSTFAAGLRIVPNPGLKPERSTSYEVGGSRSFGGTALVDVALFRTDFSDLIESGFNASGQGQFSNITDARIQGMEASAKLSFLENTLSFSLDYTYVYPRDRTLNTELKYRPRHLVQLSGLGRMGMFSAGADFRYLSRVERVDEEFVNLGIIKDGDQRVPIYVTDVRLVADLAAFHLPLVASFMVDNVFQYNYVEIIGNLAPPRTFEITLDARL